MGRPVALRSRTAALIGFCLTVVLEFTLGVAVASATTLIMPNRDALKGTAMVVWTQSTVVTGLSHPDRPSPISRTSRAPALTPTRGPSTRS
jgi:hypothetical protein